MKIGFVFPGQGSQYIDMGKDFYEKYIEARQVYDKAEKKLKTDIKKLCFEEEGQLNNMQLAIYITEMAILEVVKTKNIKAEYVAGLSLGEYAAITYAEMIDLDKGISLVEKRATYMKEEIEPGEYKMMAVMGLEDEKVIDICEKIPGFIVPVNFNCPGQVVVSGDSDIVEKSLEIFKENGAKRVIPLNVKSAFHTSKLEKAKEKLYEELKNVTINEGKYEVYKNIDGAKYIKTDDVRKILSNHIVSPVYFSKSIKNMIEEGVDTFIEIGPGKTLSGFIKKVSKDVKVININKVEDLEKLEEIIC